MSWMTTDVGEPRSGGRARSITPGAPSRSERVFAALARADTNRLFDRGHEDLAVADTDGAGHGQDRLHDVAHDIVLDHDFDPNLGHEVHHVGRPSIDLLLPTRTAKAFDLIDGHALNADLAKAILHVVQLEGLYDGFDFFHEWSPPYPRECFWEGSQQLNLRNLNKPP